MKLLLGKEANVNVTRKYDGRTPLHHAAQHGNAEVVKLLLESKAKIEEKTKDTATSQYKTSCKMIAQVIATQTSIDINKLNKSIQDVF